MLSTICRCTHEWSDIPSRSAVVCCASQRALSWVSPLAAARNAASLRLRSLGAWTLTGAIASLGVFGASLISARAGRGATPRRRRRGRGRPRGRRARPRPTAPRRGAASVSMTALPGAPRSSIAGMAASRRTSKAGDVDVAERRLGVAELGEHVGGARAEQPERRVARRDVGDGRARRPAHGLGRGGADALGLAGVAEREHVRGRDRAPPGALGQQRVAGVDLPAAELADERLDRARARRGARACRGRSGRRARRPSRTARARRPGSRSARRPTSRGGRPSWPRPAGAGARAGCARALASWPACPARYASDQANAAASRSPSARSSRIAAAGRRSKGSARKPLAVQPPRARDLAVDEERRRRLRVLRVEDQRAEALGEQAGAAGVHEQRRVPGRQQPHRRGRVRGGSGAPGDVEQLAAVLVEVALARRRARARA